jgi:hypothetical protein
LDYRFDLLLDRNMVDLASELYDADPSIFDVQEHFDFILDYFDPLSDYFYPQDGFEWILAHGAKLSEGVLESILSKPLHLSFLGFFLRHRSPLPPDWDEIFSNVDEYSEVADDYKVRAVNLIVETATGMRPQSAMSVGKKKGKKSKK